MGLWSSLDRESFYVEREKFSDLSIHPTTNEGFYFFKSKRGLVKYFVLGEVQTVQYIAEVKLIKKGIVFYPRITFSARNKDKKIESIKDNEPEKLLRARVSFDDYSKNFWTLINYLNSLPDVDTGKTAFALVTEEEKNKADMVSSMSVERLKQLMLDQVESGSALTLTKDEVATFLGRKEVVKEFESNLNSNNPDESFWQDFFENNTWIFGYGLKYVILKSEQTQPHYGGVAVNGKGGQRGDFLTATLGTLRFTTLVEIKTPVAGLIAGSSSIRNGAWSIGKELTDAISQIQSNKRMWEMDGARNPANLDMLEKGGGVYTCAPNGIIVIGNLVELDSRDKRESFERFRQSISGVEIITFDELFERAKFIISSDNN